MNIATSPIAAVTLSIVLVVGSTGLAGQSSERSTRSKPPTAAGKSVVVAVPRGKATRLDGVIGKKEWADAHRVTLFPHGEALLKHDGESLQVGFRDQKPALASLAVTDGKRIYILHASAALGTAIYEKAGADWKRVQGFAWECRSTRFDEAGRKDREAYLAKHGWTGSVMQLGRPGDSEFRIARKLLGKSDLRIAVVFLGLGSAGSGVLHWPKGAGAAVRNVGLLCGKPQERASFDPSTWARLELAKQ